MIAYLVGLTFLAAGALFIGWVILSVLLSLGSYHPFPI